jgi:hypothetical protein
MSEFNLQIPTAEEQQHCDSGIVVKSINGTDFPDWQGHLLDSKNDPRPHMRKQNQRINDCQGQALANGTEKREWYCTGTMRQRSDMYAYNGSERISGANRVGQNVGTSIQSGVILVTDGIKSIGVKPGLPTEADWSYSVYEKSSARFDQRAKAVAIDDAFVTEHGPMPDFQGMLIAVAAGGSGHVGTFWPARWGNLNGKKLMSIAPTGGGGHATEIVWAEKIAGRWYLVVWNSHNDEYYYMTQACYESLQRRQFAPFGGYVLLPDRAKERWEDQRITGGGLWPKFVA